MKILPSLPLWERGLKCIRPAIIITGGPVAPLVGAWIEIITERPKEIKCRVAPLVGAWIEISGSYVFFNKLVSLPLWERGLKFDNKLNDSVGQPVAPLVGAWIEITSTIRPLLSTLSLPLWERGLKLFES